MALLGLVATAPSRNVARPPGALPSEQFLETCIRCGACAQVCPLRTVKRVDLTYGFRNIGTPKLISHCMIFKGLQNLLDVQESGNLQDLADHNRRLARDWKQNVRDKGLDEKCLECAKICPSGALRAIAVDQVRIGTAVVDKDLCKEWRTYSCTHDCVEVCPFDAIDLAYGPVVDETKCVGCNMCNLACVSETIPRAIGVEDVDIGVSD